MMKGFCKKYFIISILSVLIDNIIFVLFFSPVVRPLSCTDYIFAYIIPIVLAVNATIVAPTLVIKKLSIVEKDVLAKISIYLFIATLVFAHFVTFTHTDGFPIFMGTWATIVLFLFIFVVITIVCLICVIIYVDIKRIEEQMNTMFSRMFKNLLIYFYVSLIILSFYMFTWSINT